MYSQKVIEHFNNPRNLGSLDKSDPAVGTGIVGSPECGDVMKLQIKVDSAETIADAKFKTFGCGAAIASSSLATEWLRGKTLAEAQQLKNTYLAEELALPAVKMHCSVLAEDAVKAAITDWRQKNGQAAEGSGESACEECPGRDACTQLVNSDAPAAAEPPRADPRLIALRNEAAQLLADVDKALAGADDELDAGPRRMLEMAASMLRSSAERDDPDQIILAINMVTEAAEPLHRPVAD